MSETFFKFTFESQKGFKRAFKDKFYLNSLQSWLH